MLQSDGEPKPAVMRKNSQFFPLSAMRFDRPKDAPHSRFRLPVVALIRAISAPGGKMSMMNYVNVLVSKEDIPENPCPYAAAPSPGKAGYPIFSGYVPAAVLEGVLKKH